MSQEVRGGVSGERLNMLYDKKPEERWNLKEDPSITAVKSFEEAKKKPQPLRGTGQLALMVFNWLMRGSEGSLPEPKSTLSEDVYLIREEQDVIGVRTQTGQETSAKTQGENQTGSPRPAWRLGDLFLRRSQQVPKEVSTGSSKSQPPASEEDAAVYVEQVDGRGGQFLKRVSVE